MKNYHNSLLPLPGQPQGDFAVTACDNLRPASGKHVLEPAPLPMQQASGGYVPAAFCSPSDGSPGFYIYRNGSALYIFSRTGTQSVADVGVDSFSVVPDGDYIIVAGGGSTRRFYVREGRFDPAAPRAVSMPRVLARPTPNISVNIPPVKLSRQYLSGEVLLAADAQRLSDAATRAYLDLDAAARAAAVNWMPMLVALRLRNYRGDIVGTTQPRLLAGEEFDPNFDFNTDDLHTTSPAERSIATWSLAVDFSTLAVDPGQYTLEVLATPPLHRLDPAEGFDIRLRSRSDDPYWCRAIPRACPVAAPRGAAPSRAPFVERLLARFEAAAAVVHTFRFNSEISGTLDCPPRFDTPARDTAAITRALAVIPDSSALPWLEEHHDFSPAAIAAGAAATLMADITVTPDDNFAAESFADSFDSQARSWHAVARLAMADGSSRVVTSQGTSGAPLSFNPVIAYPHPDAVSLYIAVKIGADIRCASWALHPDGSGRRAVSVAADLRSQVLSDVLPDFVIPSESPARQHYSDIIAVAAPGQRARRFFHAAVGAVKVIVPARHSQGAWDYGRARFLIMSSTGIYSAAVSSSLESISISRIDSRVVDGAHAVVDTGTDIRVIASGALLSIAGTRVVTLAGSVGDARALAWDHVRAELWLIPEDDYPTVMNEAAGGCYRIGVALDPFLTTQVAGVSFVTDVDGNCYHLGVVQPYSRQPVRWCARAACSGSLARVLRAYIAGNIASGSIDVRRIYLGSTAPGAELSLALDGEVRSPLSRAFIARGDAFEVSLAGDAAPGFLFHSISLD